MGTITILLFFIYIYGFGHTILRSLPDIRPLERLVLRLAVGLAAFPLLGIILNCLHIPLDWRIFLLLALPVPLFDLITRIGKERSAPALARLEIQEIILLALFLLNAVIYCTGAFSYPWLEDDDSWRHAAVAKYIAMEQNLNAAQGIFQYLNPYPPGYDLIFAILNQFNPSMYWVLKFFNALIVSLSFLFFFYFVKELTQNKNKALWATFILTVIPCYLSHFIWAHSLVITLFFPTCYFLLKARYDQRFLVPGIISLASVFVTQPTKSVKFMILIFLMWSALWILQRKQQKNFLRIIAGGMVLSLLWWGPVIVRLAKGEFALTDRTKTIHYGSSEQAVPQLVKKFTNPESGTATRAYNLKDYFYSPKRNLINNPIGVGTVLCLFAAWGTLVSLVMLIRRNRTREKEGDVSYLGVLLLWLIFTFLGMNSKTFHLPVGMFAFRFWTLFAIPVAILTAEGIYCISRFFKTRWIKIVTISIIALGIVDTSGFKKLRINTDPWPWGVDFVSFAEVTGYAWLRENIAPNTKVFTFSKNFLVIGTDMQADYWREEYKTAFKDAMQMDLPALHKALKQQNFKYLVIGQKEIKKFGLETVNHKADAINESPSFKFVTGSRYGVKIFQVL